MQTTGKAKLFRVTRGGLVIMADGLVWTVATGELITRGVLAAIVLGTLEIVVEG